MTQPCLHLHLTRIANMDLGHLQSSPEKGVFRCEECRNIFIIENIRPYEIKVVYPQGEAEK